MSTTPTGERVERKLPLTEILEQVAAGRSVALVAADPVEIVAAFDQVVIWTEGIPLSPFGVTRRHGRIDHPSGGRLVALAPVDLRGQKCDIVYAPVELRSTSDVEALVPALATSNGEIVWWHR